MHRLVHAVHVVVCALRRADVFAAERIGVEPLAAVQERMAGVRQVDEPWTLEVDLGPFEARFPKMTR